MVYTSVLAILKIEHEAHLSIKDGHDSKVSNINDVDHDRKIINWAPIFKDCVSSSFRSRGPLIHVLGKDPTATDEVIDFLISSCYYGERSTLISELECRFTQSGPIFKSDNNSVYVNTEEAVRGTSVESTSNHAREAKHHSISKKTLNLLQNMK